MTPLDKIKRKAKKELDRNDNAHGYRHALRVENLAREIWKREGGDWAVISAACLMHDWLSHKGRVYHVSEPALREIRKELTGFGFPEDKIEAVIEAIRHHEDYSGRKLSKECLILQDADRLDAIGAIGIARCFYTTALLGYPFGTPEEMRPLEKKYHIGQITPAIQHFYTKLVHLKKNMNTPYAKKLAQERHDFMLEFLRRFKMEWEGKK
ncbi:MAG: hypothetical protein QT00_C0002G0436 [archaeon GW2011_AR5]|nr:MAG: hypothetical protein QT00_C0002G0436 [archaeon GW2011_AR5]